MLCAFAFAFVPRLFPYLPPSPSDQQSGRLTGISAAKPPRAVSLYLKSMSLAVSHMVFITLSKETTATSGSLLMAQLAAVMALIAPIELRSMQGTSTSPPTGSHVRPKWCSRPR